MKTAIEITSKSYVAVYPLAPCGYDLAETIVACDTWASPELRSKFLQLAGERKADSPMVQWWYSDQHQAFCLATTPQPYHLD